MNWKEDCFLVAKKQELSPKSKIQHKPINILKISSCIMPPRIVFLGTAGDIYTVAKQSLASGGIILELEDLQFHLDPGPGSLVQAAKAGINVRETCAILLSHAHTTHAADANTIISAMTYDGLDKKGVLISPDLTPITPFHKGCLERTIQIEAHQKVGIEDIEIHTFPTKHSTGSLGYKFYTPEFTLGYLSDTEYHAELVELVSDCNVLIVCVTNPLGEKSPGQLAIDDVIKLFHKIKPKLAITTHFGQKLQKADIVNQTRLISQSTGVQVIAASDGLVVLPHSYDIVPEQKNLRGLGKKTKQE